MKKIVVAFDGTGYSRTSAEFAINITKASNSLLIGVFFYDLEYSRLLNSYAWDVPYQFYYYDYSKMKARDEKKVQDNISQFKAQCEKEGVYFKVHLDKGVALMELLKESSFADLIVIDSKTGLFNLGDKHVSTFLKDLLIESKCPVLIVPPKPEKIGKVIITYDGSESSVFAMKMFNYIFPEWSDLDTTIVTMNRSSSNHLPKNRDIKDLAERHFRNVRYEVLHGKNTNELFDFIYQNRDNSIAVMGSYGRSGISRMVHESMSNKVIAEAKIPVFVTHQ